MKGPDYNKIYSDLIEIKFPERKEQFSRFLQKKRLTVIDVIKFNEIIFNQQKGEDRQHNQKYKSYNESDILEILNYQRLHNLNNSQLAKHFKLSRNTVTKWKRRFLK